jgi:hypothetical protein
MEQEKIHLIIEIPEFDGFNWTSMYSNLKIKGIESETPLIRLDNYLFEGKWISVINSSFFLSKKKKRDLKNHANKLKIRNIKDTKFISVIVNHLNSQIPSENCVGKKLRIYRISLCLKKTKIV